MVASHCSCYEKYDLWPFQLGRQLRKLMLQFDAVLARSASALTMAAFPVFPNLIARLSRQIQRRSAWAYIPKQRAGLGAAACIAAAFSASVGAQIPGSLDTSFGASGVRITSLSGADVVNGLALQPDGKIVLAGYCVVSSQEDFCVARYTTSGNLDPSFNGPGANGVGVGTGAGRFTFPVGTANDRAYAVAIDASGRVVLAGECISGGARAFCAARLNADGSFDSSFDGPGANGIGTGSGDGRFVIDLFPGGDELSAMTIQSDGKIVLAGTCTIPNSSTKGFCAARLNNDGSFDPTFDGPDANGTGVGTGDGRIVFSVVGRATLTAIAQQPDGKLVLLGHCLDGSVIDACMARLNTDGSLDTSFVGPSAGLGRFSLPMGALAFALTFQPDGKIIVAGYCTNDAWCIARINTNGTFDTSFGDAAGPAPGRVQIAASANPSLSSVAVSADGKIVLGGGCRDSGTNDFCIGRLNSDGTFDVSFDGNTPGNANGRVRFPIGSGNDVAVAIALQQDGKIVAGGICVGPLGDNDFCLARLNVGSSAAQQCRLDIDGDGEVLATTDALILARVALGMTGDAVLAGIDVSNAPRNTWAAIRNYLVTQCGMRISG